MKIAVIGGGLFGCTAAFIAARAGHEVHLFEKKKGLFRGATGASFYRLHRGYHYPRSAGTGLEAQNSEASFRSEFWPAVIDSGSQFYAVAKGSRVNARKFIKFMREIDLPWLKSDLGIVKNCTDMFEVTEPRIDIATLRTVANTKLRNVNIHLETPMPADVRKKFDRIIVATYENTNLVMETLGLSMNRYRYQVVEKPIVRLPGQFSGVSVMVVDGPFCCIDPHGKSDCHVVGHVTQSIHEETSGFTPLVLGEYRSKARQIIEGAAEFIPDVGKADYVGSTYTVRAVLADQEETDARPTLVERMDDQVIRIFSGKLGTAVAAAHRSLEMLADQDSVAA